MFVCIDPEITFTKCYCISPESHRHQSEAQLHPVFINCTMWATAAFMDTITGTSFIIFLLSWDEMRSFTVRVPHGSISNHHWAGQTLGNETLMHTHWWMFWLPASYPLHHDGRASAVCQYCRDNWESASLLSFRIKEGVDFQVMLFCKD